MQNFMEGPQFIARQEPKKEEDFKAGLEYQREFREYFQDLLARVGFRPNGSLFMTEVPPSVRDADEGDSSLYTTASLNSGDFIDDHSRRLELLADKSGIEFSKQYSLEEVNAFMQERIHFEVLDAELARTDLDTAHRNTLNIIAGLAGRRVEQQEGVTSLPWRGDLYPVGSCRDSEYHTLMFVSGTHWKQGQGRMNVILDAKGQPLMLEKFSPLGEDYKECSSCLSLQPVEYNGFRFEAGAIFAVLETKSREANLPVDGSGGITDTVGIKDCQAFQFIRYSPLSIPPSERTNAAPGFAWFHQNKRVETNYDWITPEVIAEFAALELKRIGK